MFSFHNFEKALPVAGCPMPALVPGGCGSARYSAKWLNAASNCGDEMNLRILADPLQ